MEMESGAGRSPRPLLGGHARLAYGSHALEQAFFIRFKGRPLEHLLQDEPCTLGNLVSRFADISCFSNLVDVTSEISQ